VAKLISETYNFTCGCVIAGSLDLFFDKYYVFFLLRTNFDKFQRISTIFMSKIQRSNTNNVINYILNSYL